MTLSFLPHQHEGAKFLLGRERAGLWDEMGTGKTATAILAVNKVAETVAYPRVLVVCPAAVREVWAGEFRKFGNARLRVAKCRSVDDFGIWNRGRCNVLIVSYEAATKYARFCTDIFDVLILDEAHYAKSATSQRTRSLLGTQCDGAKGLAHWAAQTWFLTGTPMPNDPTDIWPYLRFTGTTHLTLAQFTTRYFTSKAGMFSARQTPRKETQQELRDLVWRHAIRRTKPDIGLTLPPVWLTSTTIEGDRTEILDLVRQWPGLEQAVLEAVEKGDLKFVDAPHIATLRRLVGEAKAPAYVELVTEELRSGLDKLVVMGAHTKALGMVEAGLREKGFRTVKIDGQTSEAQRIAAVRDFQADPEVRVMLGNIRAAGTGLTLTASAHIDMFESSWSPADNAQALMRVHRIGQTRNVRARFIALSESVDEAVANTVRQKTEAIALSGVDIGLTHV